MWNFDYRDAVALLARILAYLAVVLLFVLCVVFARCRP